MREHYRTKAIFLKAENRGEADQLFTLYSERFGKMEVLGKAIRKIASKLRASARLFSLAEIEFIQGKHYKILTDSVLIQKLGLSQEIAQALDKLVHQSESDPKVWKLLLDVCRTDPEGRPLKNFCMQSGEVCPRGLSPQYFLWNLLALLGYSPQLYHCVCCRAKLLPEGLFFSCEQGGVVCRNCSLEVGRVYPESNLLSIKADTIKILRLFLIKEPDFFSKLKIPPELWQDLEAISEHLLLYRSEMLL